MKMTELIEGAKNKSINFNQIISHIDTSYTYTPNGFTNGSQRNEKNQNQGSAKVFSFAKLNNLSKEDTLFLFAEHYLAVLSTPDQTDHQNIREFIKNGWEGVLFDCNTLVLK